MRKAVTNAPPEALPAGWSWASVADLAAPEPNAITDGPFGSKLKTAHYTDAGPRVIRLQNVGDADFVDAKAHISQAHFETLLKHRVLPGDVVIAALGETLPRACVVPDIGPAIVKADCIRFKPDLAHSPTFLMYALNSHVTRQRTKAIVHGVGRPRLNLGEVKSIVLPVPPRIVQDQIVGEIEKQLTRLDAAVAALRRVQGQLKRYRAAVLKAACEGRLVPTESLLAQREGRDYESGHELLRRILASRQQTEFRRDREIEPLTPNLALAPEVPAGWTWSTLDQLQTLLRNGVSAKPDADAGLAILRISAIRPLSVNLQDVRFLRDLTGQYDDFALRNGDLLFTRYNGNPELVGVCGEVKNLTTQLVHPDKLIRCRLTPATVPAFVAIMVNTGESRDFLSKRVRTTAGQAGISGADLKATPIPLAPFAEQHRIVAEVERRFSVIDELEATVAANLQRAARLRQSILQRAFEGRLVRA